MKKEIFMPILGLDIPSPIDLDSIKPENVESILLKLKLFILALPFPTIMCYLVLHSS